MSRRPLARAALPFGIAGLVVAIAVGALAVTEPRFHTTTDDPNDTGGRLDVRRIRLDHDGPTEVTVLTFRRWRPATIWDRGNVYVFVDTRGRSRPDYFVVVRSTGTRLHASLWRDRRDRRDLFVRSVKVRRKSNDGVSVMVPVRTLRFAPERTTYYWWTFTSYTSDRCRRTCIDRAPDDGTLEQWRPGMSPTPSPTETSSPTP